MAEKKNEEYKIIEDDDKRKPIGKSVTKEEFKHYLTESPERKRLLDAIKKGDLAPILKEAKTWDTVTQFLAANELLIEDVLQELANNRSVIAKVGGLHAQFDKQVIYSCKDEIKRDEYFAYRYICDVPSPELILCTCDFLKEDYRPKESEKKEYILTHLFARDHEGYQEPKMPKEGEYRIIE